MYKIILMESQKIKSVIYILLKKGLWIPIMGTQNFKTLE